MLMSIWESDTFYRKRDVIIVGAGFTGLWTALAIKERHPEWSVLVVERNCIPTGASTRNAGFACFGSLTEVLADAEAMGWDATLKLVSLRFEGLKKIQRYFTCDEIDFDLCGGYDILKNDLPLSALDDVNRMLKPITGSGSTYTVRNEKIQAFGLGKSDYLVENTLEGSLHSGKLVMQLMQRCHDQRVEFLFGTEVMSLHEDDRQIELQLFDQTALKADKVIVCTNAYSARFLIDEDIIPARGQILLTTSIPELKLRGTFHYDEGFYYFRNLGERVLLGGARNQDLETEQTTELEVTPSLQQHLELFLKAVVIPGHDFEIAQRWSGIMAMGSAKSPIVKQLSERQWCAVRLSGMGVALAPNIADTVADLLSA